MDDKQKESAMNFFEKHQKDFPQYCDQGFVSLIPWPFLFPNLLSFPP